MARTYLQLPLPQWGVDNVYLLVLFSWKVNIAENPIAVMGLYVDMFGHGHLFLSLWPLSPLVGLVY